MHALSVASRDRIGPPARSREGLQVPRPVSCYNTSADRATITVGLCSAELNSHDLLNGETRPRREGREKLRAASETAADFRELAAASSGDTVTDRPQRRGRTLVHLIPGERLGIVVLSNAFPTGVSEGIAATFFDLVFAGSHLA